MKRRAAALGLCGAILAALMPVYAAEAPTPAVSDNIYTQNYTRWSEPVRSYLFEGADGVLTRVEAVGGEVVVENYDAGTLRILESRTIPLELPLFGGFFAGEHANFMIFGEDNTKQDNQKEVIRVVKYDKDWTRLGQASLAGANTRVPFDAGSLRMAEYGGMLYIRTSHEMYTAADGHNHQANLTLSVRQADMKIVDQLTRVWNIDDGYVSHSFNQFLAVSPEGTLAAVDHGDAYPRSVVFMTYNAPASGGRFSSAGVRHRDLLTIPGEIGDNNTGVSVGALAAMENCYLVVGNSVVQNGAFSRSKTRNAFLFAVPYSGTAAVHPLWLTSYQEGHANSASTPQLVALEDGTALILWDKQELMNDSYYLAFDLIEAVHVDGMGNLLGEPVTLKASLSDCVPTAVDGKAVWYVTDQDIPVFYELDPETMTLRSNRAVSGSLDHFTRSAAYRQGQFSDVAANAWYRESVAAAYELGLVTGVGDGSEFAPDGTLTIAQAVTLAARMHSIYIHDGYTFTQSGIWYRTYVDYALKKGILDGEYSDYLAVCSREELIHILCAALPADEWTPRRTGERAFQDEKDFSDQTYLEEAYLLYQAGILGGITSGDGSVRFNPQASIKRSETAAVVARIADSSLRQS